METDALKTMTTFDSLLQSNRLQMLKAAIPYMSGSSRKTLSILTKYLELSKTIQMSSDENSALCMCSASSDDKKETTISMLQEIKPYCTEKEKESVDFFIDFLQMYGTYEAILN
ncbi:MAG: hypothetical protein ACI4CC_06155 [Lachnospiraceae bacterium]